MRLPREIGPIHFIGIGGIGMSGIAEVLCNLGYTVQGSDSSEGANVGRLRDKGVKVSVGHKAENVNGADVVVVSTAIKPDNPELMAARAQRIRQGQTERTQGTKSSLPQLLVAPFAVLSFLLVPLIVYGLVVIVFKYGYGIRLPKPFGWFH